MSKLKFKVGDKVKIVNIDTADIFTGEEEYTHLLDTIGTITKIDKYKKYPYSIDNVDYLWKDTELQLIPTKNILGGKML